MNTHILKIILDRSVSLIGRETNRYDSIYLPPQLRSRPVESIDPQIVIVGINESDIKKVGGGYIFIHRMLLEHFARLNASRLGDRGAIKPYIACRNCGYKNAVQFNFCTKCGMRLMQSFIRSQFLTKV
jgi:ribosomal protein L37E